MTTDLVLAIAHHVAVFSLAMMLAQEASLLRAAEVDGTRLARLDAGYGMTSLLVIAIGVSRVVFGLKGWEFYSANPWFWAKMAAFALVGLASVPPTMRFARWRKAAAADASFRPPADEVRAAKLYVRGELGLLFLVVAFAATMARWPF